MNVKLSKPPEIIGDIKKILTYIVKHGSILFLFKTNG